MMMMMKKLHHLALAKVVAMVMVAATSTSTANFTYAIAIDDHGHGHGGLHLHSMSAAAAANINIGIGIGHPCSHNDKKQRQRKLTKKKNQPTTRGKPKLMEEIKEEDKEKEVELGFSVSTSANVEVRALAMGVVINGISNVDPVHSTFDATLKLYFFNITEEPFSTIHDAADTIYKKSSRTTVATKRTNAANFTYFRLHEEDKADAWRFPETKDGERVHPDGICTASVMSTMKPIPMDKFKFDDVLRFPRSTTIIHPTADENGNLSHVDVIASFRTRPLNQEFYPFQIDLLDMFFEMGSSNLITEDQHIVKQKNLLCLHPSYTYTGSGWFDDLDAKAGMQTSDSLTIVPYIYYQYDHAEPAEPWITADNDHFHYNETFDETSQTPGFGQEFNLRRMIGLRIIVEHPPGKGWIAVLPILFVSLLAVANFVASDATTVGAASMLQALFGVNINVLVAQNIQHIGQSNVMAQSLMLAYCITGIWIFAVLLMVIVNKAKKYGSGNKWSAVYQQQIFNYLRMLAESLLLVYVPCLSAYSTDKGNGRQKRLTWAWALCISVIVFKFIVRAVKGYLLIRQRNEEKEADSIKAQDVSSKPMNQRSQDEVLNWVRNGPMNRESYFAMAKTKRLTVAEKLENACADGEMLSESEYTENIVKLKLVQFQSMCSPFGFGAIDGDAVRQSQKLTLLNNKTDINITDVSTSLSVSKLEEGSLRIFQEETLWHVAVRRRSRLVNLNLIREKS